VHSVVFMKSFSLVFLSFVKIHNLPFLVVTVVLVPDNNLSSFFVLSSVNIECFTILPVDEVFTFILEDLEPSWVGAPDLHVVGSSSVLDVPWLVVQSCLDGQWLLVEVPSLGLSSISCLNGHSSVVEQVKISSW
jgi:hypothetical protein